METFRHTPVVITTCFNNLIKADDTLIWNFFQFILNHVLQLIKTSTYGTQQKQLWSSTKLIAYRN